MSADTMNRAGNGLRKATPNAAFNAVKENCAILLDARDFDEYANGHAPGAICVPVNDIVKRAGEIPRDCGVYVYCAAGARSERAVCALRELGFKNAIDIEGGFKAWELAGLPVERIRRMMPVEAQMRGIAGAMVFGFTLAGLLANSKYLYGGIFVGFMLMFSAVTGICPMLSILRKAPWNALPAMEDARARADKAK